MKKFENPELSVYNFSAEDIITTSTESLENAGAPEADNELLI